MPTATFDRDTVLEQAKTLTVSTVSARALATELFDAIRAFRKQSEAQKEEVCRPLKTTWETAKAPFDSFEKECKTHEAALQQKMSAYDAEQDRLARAEQARLQALVDEANRKKLKKAIQNGKDPAEVALKTAPVVASPAKTVTTQAGTKQTRIPKTVYGIKGIADGADMTAQDQSIQELLARYPVLFTFNWVAFRKIAATGLLDGCECVEKRTEYIYAQRS